MSENNTALDDASQLNVPRTPKDITPQNIHLVDFENLKVRILCLVKNKNRFDSTASFLTRRGWELHVTDKLKEALTLVSTFKPDFVLLSVNHPHPKVAQFPQIVMRTFQVQVITFGEASDALTMKLMQTVPSNHKLTGSVSGPMAQRRIKQILQETYQVEKKTEDSAGLGIGNEDRSIRISGSNGADGDPSYQFGSGGGNDKGVIMFNKDPEVPTGYGNYGSSGQKGNQPGGRSNSGLGDDDDVDFSQIGGQGSGYGGAGSIPNAADRGLSDNQVNSQQQASGLQQQSAKDANGEVNALKAALEDLKTDMNKADFRKDPLMKKSDQVDSQTSDEVDPMYAASASGKPGGMNHSQTSDGQGESKTSQDQNNGAADGSYSGQTNGKDGYILEAEDIQKKAPAAPKYYTDSAVMDAYIAQDKRQTADKADYFERLIKSTLGEITYQEKDCAPLSEPEQLGVVSVAFKDKFGFLLIAVSGNQNDFVEVVDGFRKRLIQKSALDQQHVDLGEVVTIISQGYDFSEQNMDGFRFCFVRPIGGREIGIKFILDENAWAKVSNQSQHEKVEVQVDQISDDEKLEFDLFIYLHLNQRYFRIVNQESKLGAERKKRISNKNINVFINQKDVRTYKKFVTKFRAMNSVEKALRFLKIKAS